MSPPAHSPGVAALLRALKRSYRGLAGFHGRNRPASGHDSKAEGGPALFAHQRYMDAHPAARLDGTNNVTERAIGWCGKVRYKQMRGMKSRPSLIDSLRLNAHMRTPRIEGARSFQMADLVS